MICTHKDNNNFNNETKHLLGLFDFFTYRYICVLYICTNQTHTHTYEFMTTTSEFCKNIEKGDLYSRRLILYKRVYATKENNNIHFFKGRGRF